MECTLLDWGEYLPGVRESIMDEGEMDLLKLCARLLS